MERIERLQAGIRDIPDFPKPGITFKDITPVLSSPELYRLALDALLDGVADPRVDKVVGIDARGFIFGAPIADRLGAGFVPMRKKGKLPFRTRGCAYSLEYGEAEIEVHEDAFAPGERLWLIDDLLATGGTAGAAVRLIRQLGGELIAVSFLIELSFLEGRKNLDPAVPTNAILVY